MSTRSVAGKKKRRWPLAVAAVASILVIGAAGVIIIGSNQDDATSSGGSGKTPSPSPAALGETPSTRAAGELANGCVAGPEITLAGLETERARRDFTPDGAAQFLGAFMQFTGAFDPLPRAGFTTAVDTMTAGAFQDFVRSVSAEDKAPFSDGLSRSKTLAGASYYVESATAEKVVVTAFGFMVKDGQLEMESGQPVAGGGTYTLVPTSDGWQITDAAAGRQPDALQGIGSTFVGGC